MKTRLLKNPEFRTLLENQWITIRTMDEYEQHKWLCHPGKDCTDGCNTVAIPSRLEAMERVETLIPTKQQ